MDRLVNRALFTQHANDLGLVVTKEQLREQIATLPAFQGQTGNFDRIQYETALRHSGLTEEAFLDGLTGDIQRQQVTSAISAAAITPRTLADALYRYSSETRTAETVLFRNDSITETPQPTEEQIKTYYDNSTAAIWRRNSGTSPCLQIRPDKLTEEVGVSDEQLREEYEIRKESLLGAGTREVSQVLYPNKEDAEAALAMIREGRDFTAVREETGAGAPVSLGLISRAELAGQLPGSRRGRLFRRRGPGFPIRCRARLAGTWPQVSEIQAGSVTPLEEVADQLRADIKLRLPQIR